MIDPAALLADLRPQVRALENDLRERAAEVADYDAALRAEWKEAQRRSRTAAVYESWLEERVTQAAVAWVLGTVFLRFCEDNELIDDPYLAGPGERLEQAKDRQRVFFEQPENATKTDREWIAEGFAAMGEASPVARRLFDEAHNPMWRITPSLEAAKALIDFWRRTRTTDEGVALVHDFTDPEWDTRFLGDLYQDLSDHARKTYALLQTPEFVEEFILDLTLKEAIDEFGLDPEPPEACPPELELPRGLRLIDPTCGSGHFLLGAFHRLLAEWERRAPGADRWVLINRCLYSVHGVDKNPFAVAIARFRMLIACMRAGGVRRLADSPDFLINIAVGDSLLHGRDAYGMIQRTLDGEDGPFFYATEDVLEYAKSVDILGVGSYHVVVGNPPYITVKDNDEKLNYRKAYKSCSGQYALSVPFAERFFQLAIRGGQDRQGSGYVGQITANSFMKREFGKKLIEEFFHTIELTHVIDASGAFIPGHGTPTVILIGRRVWPRDRPVLAVLSIRGEPAPPSDPANGEVWRSIVNQIREPDPNNPWVTVAYLPRERFTHHPWSLGGGGLGELRKFLEDGTSRTIASTVDSIGFNLVTREDDAFMRGAGALRRIGAQPQHCRLLTEGQMVRDWGFNGGTLSLFPYNPTTLKAEISTKEERALWPLRTPLKNRKALSGTQEEQGLQWYEYSSFSPSRTSSKFLIAFSFVATHPHFSLRTDGRAFIRTAPVIKLPTNTDESTHLGILGALNSSAACFWLKMVSHDKGAQGVNEGFKSQEWERFYEFTSTKLLDFPLPQQLPASYARQLNNLAQQAAAFEPSQTCKRAVPTAATIEGDQQQYAELRERMIALQEELDWEVYRLYGLLTDEEAAELVADPEAVPEVRLGERAFEIVLARKVAAGETETQWFARHGSTPITEVPSHWPEEYRRVVEKRIEVIERRPKTIGLIERPEYKRRWASEPWDKKVEKALREWLLDRCEDEGLWFQLDDSGVRQPRVMTVARLADRLRDDEDFQSVLRLYAGDDAEPVKVLAEIIDGEHVPFLAALRYKDSGLRKREQWEKTWELQRQEDATGERLDIPVPPKYVSGDFIKGSYWSNRGKLDVPKERFISYPGGSPDGDGSLLLGWAGWDHRQQAHALAVLIEERTSRDGWDKERLVPLIAGLAEVMPWVRQWHGEVDPAFGMSPADAYDSVLEEHMRRHGLSFEDLKGWRPPKKRGGRKK
ncbi:BREX-2 system adenine-specific DNA-methyltransferase PglX [Thermomonospora cellulosilytica]|uniref:site-specific DNA-methyltransferase (adenine-specific) n=1 Tax=Thermomonospora cellulosilytica TaxID=1411118 RepID=A0A7W3R9U4_9ACTN|nr:BREX-2 system adenine-specific DNA-methyltransferase PglX [Thermomonospora cellulosilytica]MBA9005009.1 hypothetical protein [Thermomonospora cellulosilytica]